MSLTPGHILHRALEHLPFEPNEAQLTVLKALSLFALDHGARRAIVLNGHAGTGKTSVVGAIVAALTYYGRKTKVLAPTGRAAKVAEGFAGKEASTIHRHIYRLDMSTGVPRYHLGYNNSSDVLYIVDEASMITNEGQRPLLQQLIKYIYQGQNCAMVLVGDMAQLPPVGQVGAPAMNIDLLRHLGLDPQEYHLKEPVRQAAESGILFNATAVRRCIDDASLSLPTLITKRFADIQVVQSIDLADEISTSWSLVGKEQTIIVTRSNFRANRFNDAVRRQVLFAEAPIESGERLVIAKNNYFWTKGMKEISFLANGEIIVVDWVGRTEKRFGLRYVDLEFHIAGRQEIIGAKMLVRSLLAEGPTLPKTEQDKITQRAMEEYQGDFSERIVALEHDEHYNAIQAKYAYCVTCHKAQGGQWKHVYIDLSGIALDSIDEQYYRWLYTAMTRATDKIFLVSPSVPTDIENQY